MRTNPIYCGVDTTDLAQATKLIQSIAGGPRPAVGGIKLGLEFFLAHGAPGVRYASRRRCGRPGSASSSI
jgi:orotidine-5'-phosphate decarboxylase